MRNKEIAQIFNNIADLLEINDENPFRIRAYRRGAFSLETLSCNLDTLVKEGRLTEITGIGQDLSDKITEYYISGEIKYYKDIIQKVPQDLIVMMKIPGIGPKTVKMLYQKLNISSIAKLEEMAKAGKLQSLPGLKEKTEQNIIKGIEFFKKGSEKIPIGEALPLAEEIMAELKKIEGVNNISCAGSLRRMKETVGDIDILVASGVPDKVMKAFGRLTVVKKIIAQGPTKASVVTKNNIQVDLRVVNSDFFGAALQYFTGSKNHNVHLRALSQRKGLKVNEYGVFQEKTGKKISGGIEQDVYKVLGMDWIPPEIREDSGEIDAAVNGKLPNLIEVKDIKGDLHIHSNWSDGVHALDEIIDIAHKRGYKYIAITDHSKSLGIAGGLDESKVLEQIKKIKKIERKYKNFHILCGIEADIQTDGTLDLDKKVLEKLDIVLGAIHVGLKQDKEKITARIVCAIETGLVDIIAHPTGRLMGSRSGYEINWDRLFEVAKKYKTALEINSHYLRLDLTDINVRRAKEEGVLISINTDTHFQDQFNMIKYGVSVAKRGWLGKNDVINAWPYHKLVKFLKSRKDRLAVL
ncbi:MAG: DNA polymerase/3'-5' exonuclease PolX [Candidatus Saelkia tenebricola]|nr:DNA polymerase/3'-5' exonuclease PolX [Candidatus Saelkia tenebricola]